jgi:hypothetical protein
LRSRHLLNHSRNYQHFMVPGVSLSCSQEPVTGIYPQPGESSPSRCSKLHFNIILPLLSAAAY